MDALRDIDLVARVARTQAGRITRAQLAWLGLGKGKIEGWIERGLLIRVLPKVYALGSAAPSREAGLWEAVLYAGPGAMLSHLSAAHHRGWLRYAPPLIHVSTPRKIASIGPVLVHPRRSQLERDDHQGIPTTTTTQTLLDLAVIRPDLIERALGQLDFAGGYSLDALTRAAQSGEPGSLALRRELDAYDPHYARLNDEFEIDFYACCREWGIDPLPIPNYALTPQHIIDGYWPDHRLGVELDGGANHHSAAQLLRDANRDLAARRLGITIIRYRRAQLKRTPLSVRDDLHRELAARAPQPQG